jgi:hypothetical protein
MYSAGYSVCHRHQHSTRTPLSKCERDGSHPPLGVSLATRNPPRLSHTTCTDRSVPGPPCCISASSTCIAVVASAQAPACRTSAHSHYTPAQSASVSSEWARPTRRNWNGPPRRAAREWIPTHRPWRGYGDVGSVLEMLSKFQVRCLGSPDLRATAAGARHVVLLLVRMQVGVGKERDVRDRSAGSVETKRQLVPTSLSRGHVMHHSRGPIACDRVLDMVQTGVTVMAPNPV